METVRGIVVERRGAGEPLMLIHGTGGSRSQWRPLLERLEREREVLLVDLPGHGQSAAPPQGVAHDPIGYAGLLAAVLDDLGFDTVHAAGSSVGGWTSLELAKLGRARSVVALAPAGLWANRSPRRSKVQLWTQHRLGRAFAPLIPLVMRSDFGRTLFMGGTVGRPRRLPAKEAAEMVKTFASTPTFDTHFAATTGGRFEGGQSIDVPVTVAWGDRERVLPPKARLRDELPAHTRYVTLPECGHIPMWDDPELVVRTILDGGTAGNGEGGIRTHEAV